MDNPTCTIPDCDRPQKSRTWCAAHYQRFLRTGSPVGSLRKSSLERFWKFIKVAESGCWEWQGARMGPTLAYGQFSMREIGRRTISAHRAAWILLRGDIEPGLELDHLCKNTICANPDHLEPVLPIVNNHRSDSWAGKNARKTHCVNGHEFDAENTYLIPNGVGRRCRACDRDRERARYHKRRAAEWTSTPAR